GLRALTGAFQKALYSAPTMRRPGGSSGTASAGALRAASTFRRVSHTLPARALRYPPRLGAAGVEGPAALGAVRRFLLGHELARAKLLRPFKRRRRESFPDALQVRIAPRRAGRFPRGPRARRGVAARR